MKGGVAYLAAQILLDDCNLLAIAWLNKLWLSASLCACNDHYRANHAHPEASLVKFVHVVVVNAVLGFGLLYQREPRANYLWILLKYSLPILGSIKRPI